MSQLEFKHLHMKNFKAFSGEHTFKLDHAPGLYYITGKNFLNPELGANGVGKSTIWDALTWVLWGKTGRDNKPAAAITPWGKKGETMVQLRFNRGGKLYSLMRTRNPNHLNVIVSGEGEPREITQDDVPGLLGMSEEMFRRTLVLGQFGTLFLDAKAEAQAQMFNEALGLDIWLRAREAASRASNAAARKKTTAELARQGVAGSLENLAKLIEAQEREAELFEEDKAARIRKINKGIETLQGDLKKLEDEPVLEPKAPDQSKSRAVQEKIAAKEKALEGVRATLRANQRPLDNAADALKAFTDQKAKKKVCPECGQEISDKDFATKKAAAQARYDEVSTISSDAIGLKETLVAELEELDAELEEAERAEQSAVDSYKDAKQEYDNYIAELKAVRAELARQRGDLSREEATQNTALAGLQRLKDQRTAYRSQHVDLNEEVAQAGREQAEADFWVDGFREIRLKIIDQALLELEMATSRHAGMLGLEDWGVKLDTERETQSGKVSYSFTVLLYPPGQKEPVKWESYSGGESQRWQLAFAFALSEVLLARAGLSPNIEVLDEPTRGLSSDGVADLLDHLHDRALELGRAVFFCDHHSYDRGNFDGTVLVTKDKGGSTITVV